MQLMNQLLNVPSESSRPRLVHLSAWPLAFVNPALMGFEVRVSCACVMSTVLMVE